MVLERCWRLGAGPDAPRTARAWLHRTLRQWELDDEACGADLLTSELVTNAVQHAGTDMVMRIALEPDRLRLEVEDRGEGVISRRPVDSFRDHGYGLVIVDALADAWGCEPTRHGKRVWFEVHPVRSHT